MKLERGSYTAQAVVSEVVSVPPWLHHRELSCQAVIGQVLAGLGILCSAHHPDTHGPRKKMFESFIQAALCMTLRH